MKQKKYENIKNKVEKHNIQYIERNMEMNITNGQQKQDYYMLQRWFKTIRQSFQDKIYKRVDKTPN